MRKQDKKQTKMILIILVLIIVLILSFILILNLNGQKSTGSNSLEIPNPSAEYCIKEGHEYEIRTSEDGSQSGACVFSDGTECDGWEYYRGECRQ